MEAQEIKEMIERGLPGALVEVRDFTGGGDHFEALVVSAWICPLVMPLPTLVQVVPFHCAMLVIARPPALVNPPPT